MANAKKTNTLWVKHLKQQGYDQPPSRYKYLPRLWRRIIANISIGTNSSFLELGCGGAYHLIALATAGYDCTGVDISKEVLARARKHIAVIQQKEKRKLPIKIIFADVFKLRSAGLGAKYNVAFNVGVIEHFLKSEQRLSFLKVKKESVAKNGYVISVVPNGQHPLRKRMRMNKLGGYLIPEIDYSKGLLEGEFKKLGLKEIQTLPHNLFYYLTFDLTASPSINKLLKVLYYVLQLIPESLLPYSFRLRHCGYLICLGRK